MLAASQGCTGLGVWPYSGGDLVRVKDPYARMKLREKATRLLLQYLLGSFLAMVSFFAFAKFIVEPVIAPIPENDGMCPIDPGTNTTCSSRGHCNPGKDYCICGALAVYEGKTCQEVSAAFIVGISCFTIFLLFAVNMIVLIIVGKKGAPWIFNKDGSNKMIKAEHELAILNGKRKAQGLPPLGEVAVKG